MTNKTDYIEDTVWCNDRTARKGGWDKDSTIYDNKVTFGPTLRVTENMSPTVTCPTKRDSYTISSEKGNGRLTYPIGLLTADEVVLAGYGWFQNSTSSYLYNENIWWTMSPSLLSANFAYIDVVYSMLDNVRTDYINSSVKAGCVRPAISLKASTIIIGGNGTRLDPYVVREN